MDVPLDLACCAHCFWFQLPCNAGHAEDDEASWNTEWEHVEGIVPGWRRADVKAYLVDISEDPVLALDVVGGYEWLEEEQHCQVCQEDLQLSMRKANMQRDKMFPVSPQINSKINIGGRTLIKRGDSEIKRTTTWGVWRVGSTDTDRTRNSSSR